MVVPHECDFFFSKWLGSCRKEKIKNVTRSKLLTVFAVCVWFWCRGSNSSPQTREAHTHCTAEPCPWSMQTFCPYLHMSYFYNCWYYPCIYLFALGIYSLQVCGWLALLGSVSLERWHSVVLLNLSVTSMVSGCLKCVHLSNICKYEYITQHAKLKKLTKATVRGHIIN